MGPALAQTGLRGDCDRKSPGSAGLIFQKHRIDSEPVKQHFADCGGVACLAGNAYYNPDLHTAPYLAERLFKAGKDDMLVGRLVTAMNCVEAAGCHKAVFVWDGLSPSAKRAENSGSPDFLARARTSAYVSMAFARLRASGQAPTKMEVVDHIACYEGETTAAKLCALYGWAFVDQDSDAFAMVKPHQKVTRFLDAYTSFEITRVSDLLDGCGCTQKTLCMRWAMIGYDLDRAGVPGVGCVAAGELLQGNPTWEEVCDRYARHSVRQPGVTSAMLQRQFAVAELFLVYAYVYNPLTRTMDTLCGSEPPAELVAAAGGQGVCDAVCGVKYSDAMVAKLFDVNVDGIFFSHLQDALANRMPDPSGVLLRSTITSITTTEFEALLLAVPTDDKGIISPDVHLPAILQGYPRSSLLAALKWARNGFTDFVADVEAGRPSALPTILSLAACKTLAARLELEEDPAVVQALERLAALRVERAGRTAALRSKEQYGAVLTVLELCTGSAPQADTATVSRSFSKIQGFDTAAVEAAQQHLLRVLEDVMHGRIETLPPDVPPQMLHMIAAAAAPQHLQDLQDRLADLCAVDYIHKHVHTPWSEDADMELARLAVSRWDGQQNLFQAVGEDVPDAELPAALQSRSATTRMRRLYSLVAKMGQVDSEAYPPLTALRGALKDAPDYITAISSRLQHWAVAKDAALVQWVFEQPHPTAPPQECRGRYWTPPPAELDDIADLSLRTRFLHHLLPLAKEPAEAGESAAVQLLRTKLKDLNEHGPFFMPWEDEFDESIVDHVEERLSKNARMTVTTMERHGAALENVPHASRSIMNRYTSTLLASARKPAQPGESHAITRLRPLVPAIDLLPIKQGPVDEDTWSPEEDKPYIAALEKAVRHTLTREDCERGIDGLPGSSAGRLLMRQYRLQTAASRPTSEVEPWAVTRMREFLPVIRATRKSNTAKNAWAEHEDVAAVAYACETVEAGETLHEFPIGADAAAKAKSTEAGAHAIAGLEQRSMKAVVRHIDTALLPRALVNPDAKKSDPPDTVVAPLRATLTSAALAKGAALLTMRTVTSLNLLLPSRQWEKSSEGKPSITEDDLNNPNLTSTAMDMMIKFICKPPLKRPPGRSTKDDKRSFLLKNIEKVKVTEEVGRALVKGHSGSSLSPEKPAAEQLLERFRSLPRD